MTESQHMVFDPAEFDHHASTFAENAKEVYRELQSHCPVARSNQHGGYWVVTGYEEVSSAARNPHLFSSVRDLPDGPFKGTIQPNENPIRQGLTESDPPRLLKVRQQLSPFFAPAAVAAMSDEIEGYTTWCINQFIARGQAELISELAGPVPALVTMRLLGIPADEWRRWADVMHRIVFTPPDSPERPEVLELHHWAATEFDRMAKERRESPGKDLISFLSTLTVDGERLPLDEVVGNVNLIMAGGVDTTTTLIAHTIMHLSREPSAREWLREDPSRLPVACEEFLRFYPPIQGLARTVTEKCTLGGKTLEQHDRVWLSWAAANADPAAFDSPDEIRLDRHPNRHATFGLGPHRCIGNSVARKVWMVVISQVLNRLPDFVVDEDAAERYPSVAISTGWAKVPMSFSPGPSIVTETVL
jgi:cytochrome P450